MIKKYSKSLLICIIILAFTNVCLANPFSKVLSIFQKDLVVNVLFKDHKNLIQGSEVYFAKDPRGKKNLIGEVKKVSLSEPQISNIELVIDKKHKEKIYETTRFVLMSGLFTEGSTPSIVAVPRPDKPNQILLKQGASVKGFTFLEYKFTSAGEELDKILEKFKSQNDELLNQVEEYLENFDIEAFEKDMEDLIDKISKFSTEQKEAFKNEILPSLKQAVESMLEKFKEQNNTEKSEELENQLQEIENIVDA